MVSSESSTPAAVRLTHLCVTTHTSSLSLSLCVWILQAVPDEEPVPHPAFPPPGATAPLRHRRVLPEALHGNALLHLLLPGGTDGFRSSCYNTGDSVL